jgi:hypothetical protein
MAGADDLDPYAYRQLASPKSRAIGMMIGGGFPQTLCQDHARMLSLLAFVVLRGEFQ